VTVLADMPTETVFRLVYDGASTAVVLYLVVYVVKVLLPAAGNKLLAFGEKILKQIDDMDQRHVSLVTLMAERNDRQLAAEREQCERWFTANAERTDALRRENDKLHKETRHGIANIATYLQMQAEQKPQGQ
jgi:hypothetical protein